MSKTNESYYELREKNNVAVKKSRIKSKTSFEGRKSNIDLLKAENKMLENQVAQLQQEIIYLKNLLKEKIILSAYRKKALIYHPDKNIDKDTSADFLLISKALEVLTNDLARQAFDKLLRAKELRDLRNKNLDEKRKKFKANLEEREKDFEIYRNKVREVEKRAEENIKAEIERIRREGQQMRKAEQEKIRQIILKSQQENDEVSEQKNTAQNFDLTAKTTTGLPTHLVENQDPNIPLLSNKNFNLEDYVLQRIKRTHEKMKAGS